MSSMKQRYETAVDELRIYFGIKSRQDLFNMLIVGTSPEDARKELLGYLPPTNKKIDSGVHDITGLFQSQERAFFAWDIAKRLEEFKGENEKANEILDNAINVVCTQDVAFGKLPFIASAAAPTTDFNHFTATFVETGALRTSDHATEIKKRADDEIINQNAKAPTRETPVLSAIIVNNAMINPGTRQTDGAALFFNAIPTIEMSRCVPYFEVLVNSSSPPLNPKGKVNSMSMLQFLGGNFEALDANKTIAEARDVRIKDLVAPASTTTGTSADAVAGKLSSRSAAGMEVFTSPQTLVMSDDLYRFQDRGTTVIDKFRPLMSIKDFKVETVSNIGFIPYKSATLNVVLHDRSRMAEVAEFIKLDLFSQTELIITYGWSHPDGLSGNNVYGKFLDSLKCTEKYAVKGSSFQFDDVGQVNISLKLSLKGMNDLEMTKVTDHENVLSPLKSMSDVQEAIKLWRENYPDLKEFKGFGSRRQASGRRVRTVLFDFTLSDVSSTSSVMGLDSTALKGLRAYIRAANRTSAKKADKELGKILNTILEKRGKAKKAIIKIIGEKLDSIKIMRDLVYNDDVDEIYELGALISGPGTEYEDPFFLEIERPSKKGDTAPGIHINSTYMVKKKEVSNMTDYTSFGALLMQFVGRPLAGTGNFDEVQFVFYPFNDWASYMSRAPVSHFPIKIEEFRKKYVKASKMSPSMSIGTFIGFIGRNFISPQNAEAYGLNKIYTTESETKKPVLLKDYAKDNEKLKNYKDAVLTKAYYPEHDADAKLVLKFVQPRVQMAFECLKADNDSQTILRIHVYDAAQTSYDTLAEIWQTSQSSKINPINAAFADARKNASQPAGGPAEKASGKKKAYMNYINSALKEGVLQVIGDESKEKIDEADLNNSDLAFKVTTGFEGTKEFLKTFVPTITYGTANSTITQCQVASSTAPGLADINIMRSGMGTGISGLGSYEAGLPLAVAPVQLSINTLGFPFAATAQQFFFEFNTGTNVDNLYRCVRVSHSLSPGSFTSNISFAPINAYGVYTSLVSQVQHALKEIESNN